MSGKIPTAARYEPGTKTIRSVPENYWLATMDSWDGAVDHEGTARVFAASFAMLAALKEINDTIYAVGAPLGSDTYFAIRKLACDAMRLTEGVTP